MNTIFTGLNERCKSLKIDIATSGWILENTKFPYVSIQQVSSTPWEENSLVSRIEQNRYQFTVYTNGFSDTQDYIETLKENLEFGVLDLDYRRFNSMQYDDHRYLEPVPGIFQGLISFIIYTEKDYNTNPHGINSLRFYDGIQTINDSFIKTKMVLGHELENDQIPYVNVANLHTDNYDAHSQGLLNAENFSFFIYDYNLGSLEETVEKFHNNYDYSLINVKNKSNLTIQWMMNNITEVEAGIWRARMDYMSIIEELINV